MKFVTLASLASLTYAGVESPNTATGGLNYIWTENYLCEDFSNPDNLVEILSGSVTTSNSTFEAWKQECAELAYGLSAEYAPCVGAVYLPAGMPTFYGDGPFYSCRAFKSTDLDEVDERNPDWDFMANDGGANMFDENNRFASCINMSPPEMAGQYSCSRPAGLLGATSLTLGAAAALTVLSTL